MKPEKHNEYDTPELNSFFDDAAELAAEKLGEEFKAQTEEFMENKPKKRISARRVAAILIAAALLLGMAMFGVDALRPRRLNFDFDPSAPETTFTITDE